VDHIKKEEEEGIKVEKIIEQNDIMIMDMDMDMEMNEDEEGDMVSVVQGGEVDVVEEVMDGQGDEVEVEVVDDGFDVNLVEPLEVLIMNQVYDTISKTVLGGRSA
jgi:hypothetical protein